MFSAAAFFDNASLRLKEAFSCEYHCKSLSLKFRSRLLLGRTSRFEPLFCTFTLATKWHVCEYDLTESRSPRRNIKNYMPQEKISIFKTTLYGRGPNQNSLCKQYICNTISSRVSSILFVALTFYSSLYNVLVFIF